MSDKIITIGGRSVELEIERDGSMFRAAGRAIEIVSLGADQIEARIDGRLHRIPFVVQGSMISFSFDGEIYVAEVTEKGTRTRERPRDQSTSAPMPGMVLKIVVRPGDVVPKGAPLLILEAMKMEHQIVAPCDGIIGAIHCREGELVQPGVELVTMKDER